MAVMRLVGSDTVIIGERTFTDFGADEIGSLKFTTDIATVKTGKNGNAIFAANESGNQATLELKLLRGGDDDKHLQTKMAAYKTNPIAFTLLSGSVTKNIGDGAGNSTYDTYVLTGGVFTKNVDVVMNVSGDTEQAMSVYTIQFAVAPRAIV